MKKLFVNLIKLSGIAFIMLVITELLFPLFRGEVSCLLIKPIIYLIVFILLYVCQLFFKKKRINKVLQWFIIYFFGYIVAEFLWDLTTSFKSFSRNEFLLDIISLFGSGLIIGIYYLKNFRIQKMTLFYLVFSMFVYCLFVIKGHLFFSIFN